MKKIQKPLAKFMVLVMLFSMFSSFGAGAINALAAQFLANTVPTQVYLNVHLDGNVTGHAYIGWTISVAEHYTGSVVIRDGTYYISGAASYNDSWVDANGSPYRGWFSSTDLHTWTMLTTEPVFDWGAVAQESRQIPLDYRIIMTGGRRVTRTGLVTTEGLSRFVPPAPIVEEVTLTHTVEPGDTLAAIARRYGVTVDAIRAANQTYFAELAARNEAGGTNYELEGNVNLSVPVRRTSGVSYRVQWGDLQWGIAFNYYGTMSDAQVIAIQRANPDNPGITRRHLEAGATIYLPAEGIRNPVTLTHLYQAAGIYRVRAGDTLGSIAQHFYGSPAFAYRIYEANSERIRRVGNSFMIYEQQWLVITR